MASYKYCFVPGCSNTTSSTPGKVFIRVPTEERKRLQWLKAARRGPKDISLSSHLSCCEDHFNLEDDMENYMEFRMMGVKKRMKKGVVPHVFDCQPERRHASSSSPRAAFLRREKKRLVCEVNKDNDDNLQVNSNCVSDGQHEVLDKREEGSEHIKENESLAELKTKSVGVNVRITPKYRSKGTECSLPQMKHVGCSPMKGKEKQDNHEISSHTIDSMDTMDALSNSSSDRESEECFVSDSDDEYSRAIDNFKTAAIDFTITCINKNPKLYIGLSLSCYHSGIIDVMCKKSNLSERDVKLTLMTIKLNDSFERLGNMFGISASMASRIFRKTVACLSEKFKELIFWPNKEKIKRLLPIAFRSRYSKVQSIIDCFEIQICKPSDPVEQSLTWSDYKKCNTLKYLISCTPDGFINFVSEGYGGQISDVMFVEESLYLNVLPENCAVFADRGFKHIGILLKTKNCELYRPPTVLSGIKASKEEVVKTKCIASLRIHIERVIRRVREFQLLSPHSTVHCNLIKHMDDAVTIAAGMINLQSPIIKL